MERCEKYCVLSIDHSSRFDYELGYCGLIIDGSSIVKSLLCGNLAECL